VPNPAQLAGQLDTSRSWFGCAASTQRFNIFMISPGGAERLIIDIATATVVAGHKV